LQCPKEWRVGFIGFYRWATIRDRQYEPGFGRNRFKELLKNYIPCQKAKRMSSYSYNREKQAC